MPEGRARGAGGGGASRARRILHESNARIDLDRICGRVQAGRMSKSDEKAAREHRLALKLRENLKRRKGQAKARAAAAPNSGSGGAGGSKAS